MRIHPHENKFPGYKFLTNFDEQYADEYRKVAKAYGLKFLITITAYNYRGDVVEGLNGFWVSDGTGDLSKFWDTLMKRIDKINGRTFFSRLLNKITI